MLVIRPALPSDAAAIAAVHTASWRDSYAPLLPGADAGPGLAERHAALWARVLAPSARMRAVLVAVADGRLVGILATHPDAADVAADHLAALHVAPEARGAGIGATLMREAGDRLAALGRSRLGCRVLAGNLRARAFYRRLGGQEVGEEVAEIEPGVTAAEMRIAFASLRDMARAARAMLIARLDPPLALASGRVEGRAGAPHPVPVADAARARVKRVLGDRFGLDQFGVNRLELAPGVWSSIPHCHSHEDEFVFVAEGEVWLVSGEAEARLGPGDCAGFAGGGGRPHHLENRSDRPAVIVEIGSRLPDRDEVDYPGQDLRVVQCPDGSRAFVRRDGTRLADDR